MSWFCHLPCRSGKLSIRILTNEVPHVKQIVKGEAYTVFNTPPRIEVVFQDGAEAKQYQIKIDDKSYPIGELKDGAYTFHVYLAPGNIY